MEKDFSKLKGSGPTNNDIKHVEITVYILYSLLSLVNLLYYLPRIIKLEQKMFHLMMFTLLQICYCSYILLQPFYVFGKISIIASFDFSYYTTDELIHAIFATKYWVLSRKILQIVKTKEDSTLECKARSIFAIQVVLIFSTSIVYFILNLSPNFVEQMK